MEGIAAVGDVLAGKYRVEKILGIGGMGMVVAATHVELDQRVALKFMLPTKHESPETSARFLREARAAGRLNSDHVCRVMDVGRFETGTPYIVMEYLQGEDLAAVLRRRGPLRVSEAVDYILQGIEGLAEAHANGIIHRDLKPENLFLHKRNDGGTIVKVLDFGISKIARGAASTKTGDILGSPAYMAPEQMESSAHVDHRADVWSLGVVLYQLVVGKAPFHGDTLPLLCMHVVNDEPRPMAEIRGDLPDGFEAVVMKCLQKEPVDRYADVGELAQALAPFGPKTATTSASRIQIVLRRTRGSASRISHELSTIVDPALVYEAADLPAPAKREPHATTFSATAGQSIAKARPERHAWGLTGAIIAGIGLVALAIVVVWRSGRIGDPERRDPSPVAGKPSPVSPDPPRPPPPIVEPIIEDQPPPPVVAAPAHGPGADAVPTAGPEPTAGPVPIADRKKRRPHRPPGRGAPHAGSASGSGSAANAGSAVPPEDEDEKWMHMTHDEKKP